MNQGPVPGEHFAMTGSPDEGYYVGNIRGVPRLRGSSPPIFGVDCVGPMNLMKP